MRYGLTEPSEKQRANLLGFPAQSSVLDEVALLHRVVTNYQIPAATACRFYERGDSDIYRVTTKSVRYYLKVYRPPHTAALAEAEARFVSDVADAGVVVVRPVRRLDGGFASVVKALEGQRPVLLFAEAPPDRLAPINEGTCTELGAAIARLHQATDGLDADYDLPELDYDELIRERLPYAEPYLPAADYAFLQEAAALLQRRLSNEPRERPDFGLCHNDLVMCNIRYDMDAGVTLFDFGNASYTFRAFELSLAHRSAASQAPEDSPQLLDALLAGYAGVIALPLNLDQLLPAMRALSRLYWIGGVSASLPLRLGTEPLEGDIFDKAILSVREAMEVLAG